MIKCVYCGKEISEDNKFCIYCGGKQDIAEVSTQNSKENETVKAEDDSYDETRKLTSDELRKLDMDLSIPMPGGSPAGPNGQPIPSGMNPMGPNGQPIPGGRNPIGTNGQLMGGIPVGPNGQPVFSGMNPMGANGQPMGGIPVGPNGQPMFGGMNPMGPNGQPMPGGMNPMGPNGQMMGGIPGGPNGQPMPGGMNPMGPNGQPMPGGMNPMGQNGQMMPGGMNPMGPNGQMMGGIPVGPNGQPMPGGMNPMGSNGQPISGRGPVGPNGRPIGKNPVGGGMGGGNTPVRTEEKKKGKKKSKKKAIIISSIAATLLIAACVVVYILGFAKPDKKYMMKYFTGPDPNYENVAGVPEQYHFWSYIQKVTGENGVYSFVTDLEILESHYSFFKGDMKVALTVEDEYFKRVINADVKLSGIRGKWNIDSVVADEANGKVVEIKDEFYQRLISTAISQAGVGLEGYEKDRVIRADSEPYKNDLLAYHIIYDVTNTLDDRYIQGEIKLDGYIEHDPDYRNDYLINLEVDNTNYTATAINDNSGNSGNDNGGNGNGGNSGNSGNDNGGNGGNSGNDNGGNGGNSGNSGNDNGGNGGNSATSGKKNPVAGLPDINDEVIYFYSWNDEADRVLNQFKNKYPEYADQVKFVNLGMTSTSQEYFDAIEKTKISAAKGSIIAMEDGYTDYFASDDFYDLGSLGIDKYYNNAYQHIVDLGTFNGQLKCLSYQTCASGFFYRKDIAEEVFGTSDPEYIKSLISDWSQFESAAQILKDSGYAIVATPGDIARGMGFNYPDQSGTSEQQQIINECTSMGYVKYPDSYMWSTEWQTEAPKSNVFGYFGPLWLYDAVIYNNTDQVWKFCPGPEHHIWGGTFFGISKDCPNPGLAALVLETVCCDTDTQVNIAVDLMLTPNSSAAAQKMLDQNIRNYDYEHFDGDDMAKYMDEIAKKIKIK
ncbi:extracellular solute-binding protein [Eubacterium ruminantium]|nr:extracellular solute-binding protein [Eubacterium ruminantium]